VFRKFRIAWCSVVFQVAIHAVASADVTHPLDAEEIGDAVRVLREAGRIDEATLFTAIKLASPDKAS
jgi:Cu2+-containing amine oxidase